MTTPTPQPQPGEKQQGKYPLFPGLNRNECNCIACLDHRGVPMVRRGMVLCQVCGNKRCPHATNHIHACTGSNAPGQPGSRFENGIVPITDIDAKPDAGELAGHLRFQARIAERLSGCARRELNEAADELDRLAAECAERTRELAEQVERAESSENEATMMAGQLAEAVALLRELFAATGHDFGRVTTVSIPLPLRDKLGELLARHDGKGKGEGGAI